MATSKERVRLPGGAGGTLAGVLHHPPEGPRGAVVLAHCFTCSKDVATMTRLARAVARSGFLALRFDFTGLGESDGDFAESTVSSDVDDVVAACAWLADRGTPADALVGHSLGGTAALLAAPRVASVRAVAVVNAPSDPSHLARLFRRAADDIRAEGVADVRLAGRPFPISAAFLDDLVRHDTPAVVAHLDAALLVVHAVDDEEVPVAEGEAIVAAARPPKALVRLPDADHLLTARPAAEAAVDAVVSWLGDTL